MMSKVVLPLPGVFVREDVNSTKCWCCVKYLIEQFWMEERVPSISGLYLNSEDEAEEEMSHASTVVSATAVSSGRR